MKAIARLALVVLLAACLFPACALMRNEPDPAANTDSSLCNGYTLLYSLLRKEAQVDLLLKIKNVTPETKKLIHEISDLSVGARNELSDLAKLKPALFFDESSLPLIEKATRQALTFNTAKGLILSGQSCEVKLLITQIGAALYAYHLADALRKIDPNDKRRQWLGAFSKQCSRLIFAMTDRLAVKK